MTAASSYPIILTRLFLNLLYASSILNTLCTHLVAVLWQRASRLGLMIGCSVTHPKTLTTKPHGQVRIGNIWGLVGTASTKVEVALVSPNVILSTHCPSSFCISEHEGRRYDVVLTISRASYSLAQGLRTISWIWRPWHDALHPSIPLRFTEKWRGPWSMVTPWMKLCLVSRYA